MTPPHPTINIIIPTRERGDVLQASLRTVLDQDYDALRVFVSDNASQDLTRQVVEAFKDPRLRYLNPGRRLSMSHHWEWALGHVEDGFVSFLGDDDGLLPGALARAAEVLAETGVEALTSAWRFYFWPGSTALQNQLTVPLGRGVEVRDSRTWLARLMSGQARYPELPYVYTGGFVDLALLKRARRSDGRFFCSMIPDVYSSIALASRTDRYAFSREPLAVMGVSSHSNGAASFGLGKSTAPADKFYGEENIPFHPSLGAARTSSIRLIIYESYLQAEHLHGNQLGLELADQLALALGEADGPTRAELRERIADLAARQALDEQAIVRAGGPHRLRALLRLLREVYLDWGLLTVDASRYAVRDVHGAAQLTRALHAFTQGDHHWRRRRLAFLARRTLEEVLTRLGLPPAAGPGPRAT